MRRFARGWGTAIGAAMRAAPTFPAFRKITRFGRTRCALKIDTATTGSS